MSVPQKCLIFIRGEKNELARRRARYTASWVPVIQMGAKDFRTGNCQRSQGRGDFVTLNHPLLKSGESSRHDCTRHSRKEHLQNQEHGMNPRSNSRINMEWINYVLHVLPHRETPFSFLCWALQRNRIKTFFLENWRGRVAPTEIY